MALDSASQLGKMLGNLSKQQQVTNENLGPEEVEGQLLLKNQEQIEIVGSDGSSGSAGRGGGGGGAGGYVIIGYRTLTANSGTITVTGGSGGAGGNGVSYAFSL